MKWLLLLIPAALAAFIFLRPKGAPAGAPLALPPPVVPLTVVSTQSRADALYNSAVTYSQDGAAVVLKKAGVPAGIADAAAKYNPVTLQVQALGSVGKKIISWF